MKGLLVCIAVGCLTIASANPAEESNKQITKHFKFGKGVILSPTSFLKEEIVFGLCEGSDADQKCSIHLDKTDSYDKLNTSCYIPSLQFSGRSEHNVVLTNAGNSRAVIALKDGQTNIKLISVYLKGCQIHETSVDLLERSKYEYDSRIDVVIVAHDKNYDVFYKNWQICGHYYCKATIDYEGKVVKTAASFPVQYEFNAYLRIVYVNNGYIVTQTGHVVRVYLVKDGEDTARILFSADDGPQFTVLSSTDENKIGLCAHNRTGEGICKQYDVDGKTKITEFDFQIDEGRRDSFAVQNTEKGFILAAGARNYEKDDDEWNSFVVGFDDQGKQHKYVKIDLEHNELTGFPTLYKNSNGQYCAIFLQACDRRYPSDAGFFTSTRCFSKTELF